jgi:hypothetical protein
MTDYELQDLLNSTGTGGLEAFGMYMTLLVAYLIAAYLAGSRLTSARAFTLSILFLMGSVIFMWGTLAYLGRGVAIVDELELLHPDVSYGLQPMFKYAVAILQGLGIMSCFKFMWDIRHPKAD